MESFNSQVAETTHVPLRRLARDERRSLDDALRRVLPDDGASAPLATAAFTSAL
jgi:hypothetical protein